MRLERVPGVILGGGDVRAMQMAHKPLNISADIASAIHSIRPRLARVPP